MGKAKAEHHKGTYHQASARVRAAAYANPATRCWICKRTLDQIRAEHPRAKWTAGHVIDGQVGGPLLAECSPDNYSRGAAQGNRQRRRNQPTQRAPERTSLTW